MELRAFIKELIRNYFIIFAVIVIVITLLRQIFAPGAYFELTDIFIYMSCALVADLPSMIFYSKKEISEKEMRQRRIIHFVILEAVILTLANIMGWVTGGLNTFLFALQIGVIYMLVRSFSWLDDRRAARKINEKLKKMKEK